MEKIMSVSNQKKINLQDFALVTKEIEEVKKKIYSLTSELTNHYDNLLFEIVNYAKDSIKFDKVWQSKFSVVTGEDEYPKAEYMYFQNELGEYIKAIKVAQYKGEEFAIDKLQIHEDMYELWFTPDNFFVTRMTGIVEKTLWGKIILSREIVETNVDPLELKDDYEYRWDVDDIYNNILKHLTARKDKLTKKVEELNNKIIHINDLYSELKKHVQ